MMKRILALWLPNWPVQRVVAKQPELAGHAVVLYEEDQRYGNHVKTCSTEAAQLGVRPGMPLAEAKALVSGEGNRCQVPGAGNLSPPGTERRFLTLFLHDANQDREALLELVCQCEQFSPIVGLKQDQPDSLLMDVTGVADLHGGEEVLLGNLSRALRLQGFVAYAAIADTVGAAWAIARWDMEKRNTAEMVSEQFLRIVPPGDEAALENLPAAALCLDERTMKQLQRLGIERLGQLTKLSRGSLATRFGKILLERLDQVRGLAEEVIVVPPRPEPLETQWVFEYPTAHRTVIGQVLEQLLARLSKRLIEQSLGVLQLQCYLIPQNRHSPRELSIGLYQPTTETQHLLALMQMQLERLRLSEPIAEIRLEATSTALLEQRQSELFADASRENPRRLSLLIERLSGRLGRDSVVRPRLQPDVQPERAWHAVPLTAAHQPVQIAGGGESETLTPPWVRPLRLLEPPQPIEVVAIALSGPPAMFHYQRMQHRVARHFGPERIETGWWRGESCRRDYYRVETKAGYRLWLFRRLQDQRWFVHGEFD